MTYPAYIREKARELRVEKKLTIDELAERLAVSRTTVYYWVGDLPIPWTERQSLAQRRAARANKKRYARKRELAYNAGLHSFHALARDPTFRDFVNLYITEGYRRTRNQVSIANSDAALIALAHRWMRALSSRKLEYAIHYHADQNLKVLKAFWANRLGIDPTMIRVQAKSNSNQLTGRIWRSRFGVFHLRTNDTYLRARLEAWMDCLRRDWLDSLSTGV